MRRLPAIKPLQAIRALQRAGFVVDHVTGSHYIMLHCSKPAPVVFDGRPTTIARRDPCCSCPGENFRVLHIFS
ncbi:MAG: type II toxin-antitoxin system HicA family toxin [Firmicutes bacterium]|nr:type II toxin-antitoxin system HicA family toxin [Bacillota bacterium]